MDNVYKHDSLSSPVPHSQLRTTRDKEKKKLVGLRDRLREALGGTVHTTGITQVDPSASTGQILKNGYLSKRPDNVLRLARKQWPKRYCTVSMNGFTMAHSHVSACIGPFVCTCAVVFVFS